ncbi:DUF29 domain-containing protein [Synechococcus sp. PCC 6717]|jgi:hypothetical protein|uniref:DUF29 domain-containing protein n=1 Tax=Parathermosynechococcus lividus PCC 6715 TaxID=1917166 RepID=A0A2D2Q1Y9_PARLV|nr:DUF29 domain-containing protein [Thermostichus lividus]ATS18524.1 hypothetical protein BRW62_06885 [Thermostichus lividus PCC 6715]MCI3280663.1 DUF29 domain-containing protein [Synechococcus sp. PCC 6717]
MPSNLYETDFYAWTLEQSKLLKEGDFKHLDIPNLVEEIESLGKQQRQELRNRLGVLIGHLLKWDYQPDKRSKSWRVTIQIQRREIEDLLDENPSLKPYLLEAIAKGYKAGVDLVRLETPLDYEDLPKTCPYTCEQLFDPNFPADLNSMI